MAQTITTHGTREASGSGNQAAMLVVVLEADRPCAGSWGIALDGVHSVVIGRGTERRAVRSEASGVVTLRIDLPDGRLSEEHARIEAALGSWFVADLGSKNRTRLNGAIVERAELGDAATLECGHCVLTFTRSREVFDGPAAHANFATVYGALAQRFADLAAVAATSLPVLISGETGTGKELTARAIHETSGRAGEMVAVNCGAIPRELAESHLFGHVKGAFSGAHSDEPGHLRRSSKGTLLLDEIGDLPAPTQVALLRAIEENKVTPVGSSDPIAVDLRIVAASHRDLQALVDAGEFRADLYSRLSGMRFSLPPLRERSDDLGTAVAMIINSLPAAERPTGLSPAAASALINYRWPQNFRELSHTIRLACTLARGATIERRHLPDELTTDAPAGTAAPQPKLSPDQQTLRDELEAQLEAHDGNISAVARSMGKARQQIQRWVKRFELKS